MRPGGSGANAMRGWSRRRAPLRAWLRAHGRWLLLAVLAWAAFAPAPSRAADAPEPDAVATRIADVEARLEAARAKPGVDSAEVAALESWRAHLDDLADAARRREELDDPDALAAARAIDERLEAGPPYDLPVLDAVADRRAAWQHELPALEAAAASAAEAVERAREALARAERERRLAAEDPSVRPDLAALREEAARARLELRQVEAGNASFQVRRVREQLERTKGQTEAVFAGLSIDEDGIVAALDRFDRLEADLRRQLERAQLELQEEESRYRRRLGTDGAPGAGSLQRTRLSYRQKAVALLEEQLDRLRDQRTTARERLEILADPAPERAALLERLEHSQGVVEDLERARRLDRAELLTVEQDLAALDPEDEQRRILQARIALEAANLDTISRAIASERRLQSAIRLRVGGRTWSDRLGSAVEDTREVWKYELFASEDRPITVGKIVTALALIVVGLGAARLVRTVLENRLLPRVGLDSGAAHAFAVLAFYALFVIVVLISLQMVSIPLTAFAVLGGALAIGVGFGSQNIVNNFISGVILLAERPIKVGDLVDVEGTYGNVEWIGARSTRIRTGNNIHVIVPNSAFLESNVVNWTHQNASVRISVSVGVAYGSPTREVERRIRAALEGVPQILANPEPIVLFEDFGDNSLLFSVHFWVNVHAMMDRLRVESRVRFAIDDLMREAGITIAFPQRDVHLDSLSPIEVRLRSDGDRREGEG